MALDRNDILTDGAISAPLQLSENMLVAYQSAMKLFEATTRFNSAATGEGPSKHKKQVEDLTVAQQELAKIQEQLVKAQARNTDAYLKEEEALKKVKDELKQKSVLGDKDVKTVRAQNASIAQLEAALKANRAAYRALSSEQARNSEEGKKLKAIIDEQDKSFKQLSKDIGDTRPLVGSYEDSIKSAVGSMEQIAPATTGAITGIYGLVKASLAFIATPLGLVIAAIGAALFSLKAYFQGSEEGQNRLNKVISIGNAIFEQFMNVVEDVGEAIYNAFTNPKQALLDFVNLIKTNVYNRFVGLLELIPNLGKSISLAFKGNFVEAGKVAADALIKVGTGIDNATDKIADFIQSTKKMVDAGVKNGIAIANIQARIDKEERKLIVDREKFALQVAKLREQSILQEGAAKRKSISEAIILEQELSDRSVALAKLQLQLAELKVKANGDDKEALNEVANATAKVFSAERERYDSTLRFRKQLEQLDEKERKSNELRISTARKSIQPITAMMKSIMAPVEASRNAFNTNRALIETDIQNAEKYINQVNEIFNRSAQSVDALQTALTERKTRRINNEIAQEETYWNRRIELAEGDQQLQESLEQRRDARIAVLERKRAEELTRAAKTEKALSLFQATINGAAAVVKGLKDGGPPLAILYGILAAVQIGAIAARPLPQFEKGTSFAPGGPAIVGEAGPELIKSPSGRFSLSPGRPTLTYLQRGSKVFTADETLAMLATKGMATEVGNNTDLIALGRAFQYATEKSAEKIIRGYMKARPGDLVKNGSLLYEHKEDESRNRKLIRKSVMSR